MNSKLFGGLIFVISAASSLRFIKKIAAVGMVCLPQIALAQWAGSTNLEGEIFRDGNIRSNGLIFGRYGGGIVSDPNPYQIASIDGESHDLLLYGSSTATLHLRLFDGDLKIGSNTLPATLLLNDGTSIFRNTMWLYGNKLRFSEDRGLDYNESQDALYYNGYNNGQVVQLGDKNGNGWFLGSLGIGTSNPGSYKLAVEGKIGAREVNVTTAAWADHVFKPGYQLRPLSEVKQFISDNHHLPDVPSENEVLANGQNLGEMNAILLKKIEEVMLYILEQRDQLDSLKEEVKKLKEKK